MSYQIHFVSSKPLVAGTALGIEEVGVRPLGDEVLPQLLVAVLVRIVQSGAPGQRLVVEIAALALCVCVCVCVCARACECECV